MPSNAQDFKKSNKNLEVTPGSQWKKGAGARHIDVELPSGNVAKIKQIPMPTLLADGLFPDSLQGYIKKAIGEEVKADGPKTPQDKKPKKKTQDEIVSNADMQEMISNPETVGDLFAVFDKVTLLAVVEPKVLPVPEDEADRDDELLYVDEVDMEDKAFIFKFCVGGSKELESFRAESESVMGSLADLSSVQNTP